MAASRRVALSRAMSAFLVASTTASCLLLQRSGLVDLALGRMSVAFVGALWFVSTFTEVGCFRVTDRRTFFIEDLSIAKGR